MTNTVSLATLKLAALNSLYGAIVTDYAPAGIELATFKAKADAVGAIEAACAAGNLAVSFDSGSAVIVDMMEAPEGGEGDEGGDEAIALATGGADGKGKARAWGFATAGEEWLAANPRGTAAREAYRKERRKAARKNRKDERAAKEAMQASN